MTPHAFTGSLHSFCYVVKNWPIRKLGKHSTVQKPVYKRTKESKIREGDLVTYVKSRPKLRTFRGPYQVHAVTSTSARIQPINKPDAMVNCVSLQRLSRCAGFGQAMCRKQ